MREGKARHRHAQLAGIGEVRKTLRAGRMLLAEDDVAVGPGERAPAPDMALQGAQLAIRKASGMPTLQLAQDGDRLQRRHRLHQRNDLGFPDPLERVGARPIDPRLLALLRQGRIAVDAASRALADPGLGGGGQLQMDSTMVHVRSHLVVVEMAAWH